jgi:hypothetical protein
VRHQPLPVALPVHSGGGASLAALRQTSASNTTFSSWQGFSVMCPHLTPSNLSASRTKTIDKLTASTATSNDQVSRKRRLVKGPEEFQEIRRDRPNRK